ncbi:thiol reductant ABC exporter subunit CydD [Actinomadura madurae]|uniref:thiol reductant ABC exporter subunit CydD n=1 Tax=Actinomadura madurae TaxID=1993 RepID=UPI002025CB8E|nr:thiol reductant ABC exporter subunit CydD [Actinomadura madurae]URM97682.1 thiol reductant ABC exporter subunit CydD [Actinomadura madurae]URN08367.1 thiol reductant ABC exporter subunit CydD [Actinomadura madurae]
MKPLDPRLLRYARTTRLFLLASVALGTATAGLIIAQATLLAAMLTRAFLDGASLADLRTPMLLLLAVVLARTLVAWLAEVAAHRSSAAVKSELRRRLLAHALGLGPRWLSGERSGELATLATRGIDALDDYFSRYLPQLVLAVIVPVAVGARILLGDWLSAVTIAATLPLIPVFAILVGLTTQRKMDRQWRTLSLLSAHFLDVVAGLPTLKIFGRARAQAGRIREITDRHRRATMSTLRIAFLSALVLELLSTLSVALVAVSIGLRLVEGGLGLETALLVLILAPEAYLPLRQVGAQYHASVEGLTAASRVFEVLETPLPASGTRPDVPDLARATLRLEDVTVTYPDRDAPALDDFSLTVHPGETVALVGPSGAGKSTALSVLLGFVRPDSGRVLVDWDDLATFSLDAWRAQIAWVPQRPYLFAGPVAANIRLGRPDASDAEVRAAAEAANALSFIEALPSGFDTPLGDRGTGLSAGQRQRIALARAFLRDAPLLLLDEPTSGLDGESEAAVIDAVARLATSRTVILVAHRPTLLPLADRVIPLTPTKVTT